MFPVPKLLLTIICTTLYLLLQASPTFSHNRALVMTPAEQDWLHANTDIHLGVALIPPYLSLYDEQGRLTGLAVEYARALENQLGTQFHWVVADNYGEMIAQARNRTIDVVFAATSTPERARYLNFSRPYTHMENRIFIRQGEPFRDSMADFNGRRFAVSAGTALAEFIRNNHPGVELVQVPDLGEAFSQLSAGLVDGVGADSSSGYARAASLGLSNIRVSGKVGFDYEVAFAVRNDQTLLSSIISKALDAIPRNQRSSIDNRWITPVDPDKVDRQTAAEIIYLTIIAGTVLVLLILGWWNRSLKKEISHRKAVENRLSYLAYHDDVTGILNRSGFMEQLHRAADSNQHYLLLMIGLDHFRVKNDLWGQSVGNEILRLLARKMKTRIPPGGCVGRTGGDTFACMIPAVDERPESTASAMLGLINEPLLLENGTVQLITATMGVDLPGSPSERPEHPFERAEIALKYGKRVRRGGFHLYDRTMSHDISQDQRRKDALMLAISQNQLLLEYQPQLDLSERRVIGFEALVRWQHPEKGRISPAEFIPLAERLGLITALGNWVLKEACRQGEQWRQQGLSFDHIAVNVSVQQFAEGDFVSRVIDALDTSGLPPGYLELEITETFLLGEFDKVRQAMERLSERGVRFSIDDFGTGFSSMLYLKQLPVETIKLAQEFVLDITHDSGSYQIVRASTQLGKSLGMNVIAEGIEDQASQEILLRLGCERAQGYYYSKPLPADQICSSLLATLVDKISPLHRVTEQALAEQR